MHIKAFLFANNVVSNGTAHDELSHQNLHCLPLCFDFLTETPIGNKFEYPFLENSHGYCGGIC